MNWNDYLIYNPMTGDLTWKERSRDEFTDERAWRAWNTRFSGISAGKRDMKKGRPRAINVKYLGKAYLAHRIIWTMVNGQIPSGLFIDHINRDPWDNRLANLRLATNAENLRNRRMNANNTSGYKGVNRTPYNTFEAQITINNRKITLGYFATPELAHEAYCSAAKIYHGEFAGATAHNKN